MKKYNVPTLDIPDNFFEYMIQSKIILGNRIQQDLYLNFKEFESLNYILINDYIYSSDIKLEIEFYEDEYLLETLDDPDMVLNTLKKLKSILYSTNCIRLDFKVKIVNKKRKTYNKENINEVVYCNDNPKIKYEGAKINGLWNFFKKYRSK